MLPETFRCLLVEQAGEATSRAVTDLPTSRLPDGDVVVRVEYSSLNYKDAMAAYGQRGVVKTLPHIPGIDAAGRVLASNSSTFVSGEQVIVTGYDLGQGRWGGWADYIRVPASWLVKLPSGLTTREAMVIGTAGFTAAQCVRAIRQNGLMPEAGEVIVTGATGGVGSLTVQLLAQLGYSVVAVSGKLDRFDELIRMGASRVIPRSEFLDGSKRPLLSAAWAGGVDTVGGNYLSSLLRQIQYGGSVAACGLVAGAELEMTVYPFLLRGISLCGVASADCPMTRRLEIWNLLANEWKLDVPESHITEVDLPGVVEEVDRMLAGDSFGRVLVALR